MTEGIDRDRLEAIVKERSELTLDQLESMFGPITASNKKHLWNFLQMPLHQQQSVWNCRCYLRDLAPDHRVEAVR